MHVVHQVSLYSAKRAKRARHAAVGISMKPVIYLKYGIAPTRTLLLISVHHGNMMFVSGYARHEAAAQCSVTVQPAYGDGIM